MFFNDPVTILLTVILCVCCVKTIYGRKRSIYQNFPPGPTPLPLIGNMHIMNLKKPYKTFLELSKKYGNVFSFKIGMKKMVVLCGYETVKDALVNHAEEFSERPKIPIFQKLLQGNGIVFAHGENWKVMRRFTLSTLRDFGMGKKSLENKISEECDFLVKIFNSYKDEPFDNIMIINASVANIIVSILLGHRFKYDDPTFLRLMSLINENIRLLASPMVTEKSGLYFHNDNLTSLVSNLFGAGTETTSTTIRWGLLLMMKYPDIQKKVQNEIDKVIGLAQPQTEHRKEMPYTDAVIHEIQRFSNIIPANIPHETAEDVTFRGYFLPKGTYIIPLLASVLQDKAHFEKPEEFYPQHFLDTEGNFIRKEAFMPFSAGKRACAGENLARMELFLFFTRLLQKFTFRPPPGAAELDLTPAPGLTSSPLPHEICALPRF
ncbi:hypothetical protein FKM82_025297 [Ascaphus truei]